MFRFAIAKADVVTVISPEMGKYLESSYRLKKSIVIHDGYEKKTLTPKADVSKGSFLYVGLIQEAQMQLINRLMAAMQHQKEHTFKIGVCSNSKVNVPAGAENIEVNNYGWVDQDTLNNISKDYSYGLLPLGFGEDVALFYRTSLMTKIPFYLSVGLPVCCIGPEDAAAIRLIKREIIGAVCTEDNIEALGEYISSVATISTGDYQQLVANGDKSLSSTFNKQLIIERFYNALN